MLELADPPTAIFAGSDMQAMGVYEAARLHRLRIPDDLSVVGFDDLPMSGWVSPPLTTIIQPLAQMAAMATRTIPALLDGRTDTSSNRVELTTSLVVRSSTVPPRKGPAGRGPAGAGRMRTGSSRDGRKSSGADQRQEGIPATSRRPGGGLGAGQGVAAIQLAWRSAPAVRRGRAGGMPPRNPGE